MEQLKKQNQCLIPVNQWQFTGHLGKCINRIADKRILSQWAQSHVYPETEEAFHQRIDDRSHPGRGVWRGEFWGKWLLSAIAAWHYYGENDELKDSIAKAVDGLLTTQDDDGYIGTYHDSCCAGENTWNIWCRKYTLWGLIEAYEILENKEILERACCFCDHLIGQFGPDKSPIINTGQFCGLPSTSILGPVVKLYRATGKSAYLDFAKYIVSQWQMHELGIPDILRKGLENIPVHTWFDDPQKWAKSYEFISCVEGLVELYHVTNNADLLVAATNIHQQLVDWERSPVGSVSYDDKFIGSRFLKNTLAEICDAVYWNRLSFELLRLTKDTCYLDEIERTLYNTLLCGMSPDGTWGLRRLRLSHQHIPAHKHFLEHHQCCVANLPRGLFQAAQAALLVEDDQLYLGLYNEAQGEVQMPWGQAIHLTLQGDFLADEPVTIQLNMTESQTFTLNLRVPFWCTQMKVLVNDQLVAQGSDQAWLPISRCWQPGDRVTIMFTIPVRQETFEADRIPTDDPRVAWHGQDWVNKGYILEEGIAMEEGHSANFLTASDVLPHTTASVFFYGPLVLARDIRLENKRDIFEPLTNMTPTNIKPCKSPANIWKVYELQMADRSCLRFCDFSSAGNTWDQNSLFNTWLELENEN